MALVTNQIQSTLNLDQRFWEEVYTESLDAADLSEEVLKERQWYIHKYHDHIADLIIALGPSPLHFMVDAHEIFFFRHSDCLWWHQ